jgi:transposase
MFFDELSNDEWVLLSALVADEPAVRLNRRGRPRAEPRVVANAVLWILTTGEPWSRLPGRYPSGPTCRRRFEEWQLNGTLAEMVQILSQTGRRFAYVPEPTSAVASAGTPEMASAPARDHRDLRDDGSRGVFWKSPESWQAPHTGGDAGDSRPVDPFAEITRQLSGSPDEVTTRVDPRALVSASDPAAGTNGSHHERNMADEAARSPLWMGMSSPGEQLADRRGYVIYVMAQSVPHGMYRAWAEIMKDGRRVERSGLVGPRFETPEAAERHAFEWAQQWIDRHCRMLAAAALQDDAVRAGPPSGPVSRPMPAPRPAVTSVPAVTAAPVASATAPAAGIADAPAVNPAKVHMPAHANVNHAHRMPLRRYPGESPADGSGDRFPSGLDLIAHHG